MTSPDVNLPRARERGHPGGHVRPTRGRKDCAGHPRRGLIVAGAALTALAAQCPSPSATTRSRTPSRPRPCSSPAPHSVQGAGLPRWHSTSLPAPWDWVSSPTAGAAWAETGGGAPTIGYLFAFIVAATLCGRLAQRQWERTRTGAFGLMLLGSFVIYLIGVPILAVVTGLPFSEAIYWGAIVFIPWDLAKVVVATFAFPFAWRLAGDRTGE